jgi:hypothetical protein
VEKYKDKPVFIAFGTLQQMLALNTNRLYLHPLYPNIVIFLLINAYIDENRSGKYVWEDHRPRSGVWKGTSGGEVISFSGCDDDQTSADTSVLP